MRKYRLKIEQIAAGKFIVHFLITHQSAIFCKIYNDHMKERWKNILTNGNMKQRKRNECSMIREGKQRTTIFSRRLLRGNK
jgi:hypothetical protein